MPSRSKGLNKPDSSIIFGDTISESCSLHGSVTAVYSCSVSAFLIKWFTKAEREAMPRSSSILLRISSSKEIPRIVLVLLVIFVTSVSRSMTDKI